MASAYEAAGRSAVGIPEFDVREALRVGTAHQRARFWRKVERTDGCWWWRGLIEPGGYAYTWIKDEKVPVARAAFMFAYGTIPSNEDGHWPLYSSCRRRLCVNPAHHALGEINRLGQAT